MCVEGFHIYVSLVKVFEIDKKSRLVCYSIFAYVAPGIIVIVSAAIRNDGYGTDKRYKNSVLQQIASCVFCTSKICPWKKEVTHLDKMNFGHDYLCKLECCSLLNICNYVYYNMLLVQ